MKSRLSIVVAGIAVGFMALISTACAQQTNAKAVTTSTAGVQCPSRDFRPFLTAFVNRVEVQRAFTRYPYEATVYDTSDLEADPTVSRLGKADIEFPVMLSEAEMARHGARMTIQPKGRDWFEVSTQSEGTGAYTMTFNFRFLNGCWYLTDSIDAST